MSLFVQFLARPYLHPTDEHGNVSAISDTSRNVVADYDFDAFGNETVSTDTYYNPMRYCGEYYDAETGLIYLRARYYDPSIGRFISEDPIKDGTNRYVYCSNNPIAFVDPSGLKLSVATEDYDKFLEQARAIYGNDNLEFDYTEVDGRYVIENWVDIEYSGGSSVGRDLLKVFICDKKDIQFYYMADGDIHESKAFDSNDEIKVNMKGWNLNSPEERNATLIHELTHAYIYLKGYDEKIYSAYSMDTSCGYTLGLVDKLYQESTAILIEEMFRRQMGYQPRSSVTKDTIGNTRDSYGAWLSTMLTTPFENGGFAPYLKLKPNRRECGLTRMQEKFIYLDIRLNANSIK